eukprot:CAMPEP_0206596292 /NCGR_PEP_ID=MMETSP0325_2-20121206/43472_1 /ASSEMBLY_ACC=CAM_ASM_000347 /TAXON_ID=2866 /ORGANISM="Crypthecodinium cohnii, Strain Seligo" /LENGTH=1717 /DNA_ID=CAMNT_0054107095 /DNA_START=132 /DNA_END=5285 /DNA_ORIENTATION=-
MNNGSSRSHCIFTFRTAVTGEDGVLRKSQTHLVDLAGSERAGRTQATGDRLKEGAAINKSLTSLATVIRTLADNAEGKKKEQVPPFRDSKLTYILKESLCGNSRTIMMAAISPSGEDYEETMSTLRFATQLKKVQLSAKANEQNLAEEKAKEEAAKLKAAASMAVNKALKTKNIDELKAALAQTTELGIEDLQTKRAVQILKEEEEKKALTDNLKAAMEARTMEPLREAIKAGRDRNIDSALLRKAETILREEEVKEKKAREEEEANRCDFNVGDRVIVAGKFGTVKFAGLAKFSAGAWVGVALDSAVGKNDGTVQGERYFECEANHGVFIRPAVVSLLPPEKDPLLKPKEPPKPKKKDEEKSPKKAAAKDKPKAAGKKVAATPSEAVEDPSPSAASPATPAAAAAEASPAAAPAAAPGAAPAATPATAAAVEDPPPAKAPVTPSMSVTPPVDSAVASPEVPVTDKPSFGLTPTAGQSRQSPQFEASDNEGPDPVSPAISVTAPPSAGPGAAAPAPATNGVSKPAAAAGSPAPVPNGAGAAKPAAPPPVQSLIPSVPKREVPEGSTASPAQQKLMGDLQTKLHDVQKAVGDARRSVHEEKSRLADAEALNQKLSDSKPGTETAHAGVNEDSLFEDRTALRKARDSVEHLKATIEKNRSDMVILEQVKRQLEELGSVVQAAEGGESNPEEAFQKQLEATKLQKLMVESKLEDANLEMAELELQIEDSLDQRLNKICHGNHIPERVKEYQEALRFLHDKSKRDLAELNQFVVDLERSIGNVVTLRQDNEELGSKQSDLTDRLLALEARHAELKQLCEVNSKLETSREAVANELQNDLDQVSGRVNKLEQLVRTLSTAWKEAEKSIAESTEKGEELFKQLRENELGDAEGSALFMRARTATAGVIAKLADVEADIEAARWHAFQGLVPATWVPSDQGDVGRQSLKLVNSHITTVAALDSCLSRANALVSYVARTKIASVAKPTSDTSWLSQLSLAACKLAGHCALTMVRLHEEGSSAPESSAVTIKGIACRWLETVEIVTPAVTTTTTATEPVAPATSTTEEGGGAEKGEGEATTTTEAAAAAATPEGTAEGEAPTATTTTTTTVVTVPEKREIVERVWSLTRDGYVYLNGERQDGCDVLEEAGEQGKAPKVWREDGWTLNLKESNLKTLVWTKDVGRAGPGASAEEHKTPLVSTWHREIKPDLDITPFAKIILQAAQELKKLFDLLEKNGTMEEKILKTISDLEHSMVKMRDAAAAAGGEATIIQINTAFGLRRLEVAYCVGFALIGSVGDSDAQHTRASFDHLSRRLCRMSQWLQQVNTSDHTPQELRDRKIALPEGCSDKLAALEEKLRTGNFLEGEDASAIVKLLQSSMEPIYLALEQLEKVPQAYLDTEEEVSHRGRDTETYPRWVSACIQVQDEFSAFSNAQTVLEEADIELQLRRVKLKEAQAKLDTITEHRKAVHKENKEFAAKRAQKEAMMKEALRMRDEVRQSAMECVALQREKEAVHQKRMAEEKKTDEVRAKRAELEKTLMSMKRRPGDDFRATFQELATLARMRVEGSRELYSLQVGGVSQMRPLPMLGEYHNDSLDLCMDQVTELMQGLLYERTNTKIAPLGFGGDVELDEQMSRMQQLQMKAAQVRKAVSTATSTKLEALRQVPGAPSVAATPKEKKPPASAEDAIAILKLSMPRPAWAGNIKSNSTFDLNFGEVYRLHSFMLQE